MKLPRQVSAVIFDMDGLLIDSEVVYRDAILAAAVAQGREMPLDLFHRMIGAPIIQNRQLLVDHYGADFDIEALLVDSASRFHATFDDEDRIKAGVAELLDFLDTRRLPRAIATSSPHDSVRRHLGPGGLLGRFQAVIARGDYVHGKPAPDPFLAAAAALGVAPETCLALEDSHNGVRAAHAAGMMTVMVPDLLEATDEMRGLCIAVVGTLHDVVEMLGKDAAAAPPPPPAGAGGPPPPREGG
ncbi:MAG TPA: HAD family phosphatase [Caulobacteraceae bacterium]